MAGQNSEMPIWNSTSTAIDTESTMLQLDNLLPALAIIYVTCRQKPVP
jgi:hypothetical protein